MTRNIGSRYSDLFDEISMTLESLLAGADKDWVHIPTYLSVVKIVSRYTARFFVGPELSSNKEFTKLMEYYAAHVPKDGATLSRLPSWLRPVVSRTLFDTRGKAKDIEEYLRPIITKRLERDIDSDDFDPDSNNMITWLWRTANEGQRTIYDIAIRLVWLDIASIITTSTVLTHILFDLATYNLYIEPLREEISTIVETEGWNKVSMEKMRKLDSFMKESHRLNGSGFVMTRRLAMSDFSFSDGTFIPKGTNFVVAGRGINQDERYYENPQEFQGFRFADKDPLKWQMTAINSEFMLFGIGRSACPGRFFAVAEMKTVIAQILLNYDIKLTEEKAGRPQSLHVAGLVHPSRTAKISLKKRVFTKE
ncbi:hypothetical protein Ac2012v2_000096 [Leucoagaricus gongylophorus]